MKKVFSLCIITRGSKVLLGFKKIGFGAGRWNGFGGKVEEGENPEQSAVREVAEEAGLKVNAIEKVGLITFTFEDGTRTAEVHIYRSDDWSGEPTESEEMRPAWFENDSLPFKDMWLSDAHWLPWLLAEKKFEGEYHYDRPTSPDYENHILKQDLREVTIMQ